MKSNKATGDIANNSPLPQNNEADRRASPLSGPINSRRSAKTSGRVKAKFFTEVVYTREEILTCLRQFGRLDAFVTDLVRVDLSQGLRDVEDDVPFTETTALGCAVEVVTRPGYRFLVEMTMTANTGDLSKNSNNAKTAECSRLNYVDVSNGPRRLARWRCLASSSSERTVNASALVRYAEIAGRILKLKISVRNPAASVFFKINVQAVYKDMEVVRPTPTFGFVTTTSMGEGLYKYPHAWVRIFPIPDHVILTSLHELNFPYVSSKREYVDPYPVSAYVQMYVSSGSPNITNRRAWATSGWFKTPKPYLVDPDAEVSVQFGGVQSKHELTGITLIFSYHLQSRRPYRVNGSRWNCSVSEWPAFERHFRCDVDRDCEGDEDEVDCFGTGHCGQGRVVVGKRCYSYVRSPDDAPLWGKGAFTWIKADAACVEQGGQLVSLNTAQEWRAVCEFLKSRRTKRNVFVGLRSASLGLPLIYKYSFQWVDGSIAYFMAGGGPLKQCGRIKIDAPDQVDLVGTCLWRHRRWSYMCEFESPPSSSSSSTFEKAMEAETGGVGPIVLHADISIINQSAGLHLLPCPRGHLTQDFMACDVQSACWAGHQGYRGDERMEQTETDRGWGVPSRASCPVPNVTSLPAMFACSLGGLQRVPYTVVCDHRRQCADGSDENFCDFPPCSGSTLLQCVLSSQCVALDAFCDQTQQCADLSDESDCADPRMSWNNTLPPPAIAYHVRLPTYVYFQLRHIPESHSQRFPDLPCPHTHFQCPPDGYCLPVYLRCNGVDDCPGREDEAGCEAPVCPGFYRCRASKVCLHVSSVCDGARHCPEQDDELYCAFPSCPRNCTCHGLAFACGGAFSPGAHLQLRYLDASGSRETRVDQLLENVMLVHLSLSHCGMRVLDHLDFPNLRSLDLSDNFVTEVSVQQFRDVTNLQTLILSGNPLVGLFADDLNVTLTLDHLQSIDLARLTFDELDLSLLDAFPNLLTVNISHSAVGSFYRSNKSSLKSLRILDMRHADVAQFQYDVMSNMDELEAVFAETFKLCCPVFLPQKFNPNNCRAPPDRMSSCDNLLPTAVHRIVLALCCCSALLGNVVSIVLRVFVTRSSGCTSTNAFVTHLAVGDAVMGMCVAMVAVADRLHQGSYVLEDTAWRHSVACKTVGFLFLLSSQLSVKVTFLITMDAVALTFLPRRRLFTPITAGVTCAIMWTVCAVLAAWPLLASMTHWKLFSQTAVCIPILATADRGSRQATFSVAVIVFNLVLTVLTAAGHARICSTTSSSSSSDQTYTDGSNSSDRHSCIPSTPGAGPDQAARGTPGREIQETLRASVSPCVLHAVCWLALCALALLARRGSPLLDELHEQVALFGPPVASALRPILLALGERRERTRRRRVKELTAHIAAQRRYREKDDPAVKGVH